MSAELEDKEGYSEMIYNLNKKEKKGKQIGDNLLLDLACSQLGSNEWEPGQMS